MKAVTIDKYRPIFTTWPHGEDYYIGVGQAFGGAAWTDGHILMAGEPPHESTSAKTPDFSPIEKRCFLETLKPITPLGVVFEGSYHFLVFDDSSIIQAKFYALIVETWPTAIFFCDGWDRQISARVDGKPVAAIMPVRTDHREDYRNAVLQSAIRGTGATGERKPQSANAEESQAAQDCPEERQRQKESGLT